MVWIRAPLFFRLRLSIELRGKESIEKIEKHDGDNPSVPLTSRKIVPTTKKKNKNIYHSKTNSSLPLASFRCLKSTVGTRLPYSNYVFYESIYLNVLRREKKIKIKGAKTKKKKNHVLSCVFALRRNHFESLRTVILNRFTFFYIHAIGTGLHACPTPTSAIEQ